MLPLEPNSPPGRFHLFKKTPLFVNSWTRPFPESATYTFPFSISGAGNEKNIAYWSGANGVESARCLIQYMEETSDSEIFLTLFYSNPTLYATGKELQGNKTVNVIYYHWLLDKAKKMENLKVVFTFTREKELSFSSDHPRIIFRSGRFFSNFDGTQERSLSKYHAQRKLVQSNMWK